MPDQQSQKSPVTGRPPSAADAVAGPPPLQSGGNVAAARALKRFPEHVVPAGDLDPRAVRLDCLVYLMQRIRMTAA